MKRDPFANIFDGLSDKTRDRLEREREEAICIERLDQVRRDDFDRSISSAIWSMMLFTLGRSFGKLFASRRTSPPIACGVKCCDERAAIARTASDSACAKAVVKSASNSSSLSMIPLVSENETPSAYWPTVMSVYKRHLPPY